MANILLVSEINSFLLSSLITQLEEDHHTVYQTPNEPNEIGKYKEGLDLILLYAEELSLDGLVFLKDKAIEEGIPILLLGDINEVMDVEKKIPPQLIQKKFIRPVNVKEVAHYIDKIFTEEDKGMKKRILVVDDSGAMLRSVKGWLEDKYQVVLANSGTMAIKYLAIRKPDLILLDYEMPICDGKQVLEMIRSEVEFSDIPVMFLTNKSDKESVMSVSGFKLEGYLLKSMEPEKIVAHIDEFFEKKKWTI